MSPPIRLDLTSLSTRYHAGDSDPVTTVDEVYHRIAVHGDPAVWLHLVPHGESRRRAQELAQRGPASLPLFGIPFGIKDNIDLAGVPTTAACPAFAYTPQRSATVVERLIAAGAIPIGKLNLDQFATGVVGVRSPYGIPRNPFDAKLIPGGSSSGSGVAVATGLVSFALGTDTAGSGRVPAACTNTVGLKPTRGWLSTWGVVPAVRSLDCVSIHALTCGDAWQVVRTVAGFDPADAFSRRSQARPPFAWAGRLIGIPATPWLRFFGDRAAEQRYRSGIERLVALGCRIEEIDFAPFDETANLLYQGPWVAERFITVADLLQRDPDALLPVTQTIINKATTHHTVDAFRAFYRLAELRRLIEPLWTRLAGLALPTIGTLPTIAELDADPVTRNNDLGYYTNFVNLLDLCAIAVPNGFTPSGQPVGLTLMAPAWQDAAIARLGDAFHRQDEATCGAMGIPLPIVDDSTFLPPDGEPTVRLAVIGAHLSGMPLHHELTERAARLDRVCRTAPIYRLLALSGAGTRRPGLVRTARGGAAIAVEVWHLPLSGFASLVAAVTPPLAIGTVQLDDGSAVKGFLCEHYASEDSLDISGFGGWRTYLEAR